MKKFVSTFLTVCALISSLGVFVSADNTSRSEYPTQAERNAIIEVLNVVSLEKEAVGLQDVDFSDLYIGERIYRYVLTEDGLETTCYSYPILLGGTVVLVATSGSGNHFQITTYEADLLNSNPTDRIAFINDDTHLYFYDGVELKCVDTYETIQNRVSLQTFRTESYYNEASAINSVQMTNLSNSMLLGYEDIPSIQTSNKRGGYDNYYSCTVDFVSQNTLTDCWAASTAMVTNYMKGTSYTSQQIYDQSIQYVEGQGATMLEIAYILRYQYECGNFSAFDTDSLLSDSAYVSNMVCYCPVIAGFKIAGRAQHHATVVDAIHTVSGYIRVCDPYVGRIYTYRFYDDPTQSYYGEYTYTSPASSDRLFMVSGASIYS